MSLPTTASSTSAPTAERHAEPARGRWAPTPSGLLHVGNARTALVAWLSIRRQGGRFLWRLEDLDPPRVVPGMAEAAEEDLRWLGLDWDEGPEPLGGPVGPYLQSQRTAHYQQALARLAGAGRLFPCRLSRADLARIATAPHGSPEGPPYPVQLRPAELPSGWYEDHLAGLSPAASLRFRVDEAPVSFEDRLYGPATESVSETVGDFVLQRRDGLYAYQLAVVVDDLAMGVTEVVRGADLLASTARQIQLIEALGGKPPVYGHVPLVENAQGEKLSKRDRGLTLRSLREAGVPPERLVGEFASSLGLLERPEPCRPQDLVPLFDWSLLRREDWTLPESFGRP
ncbi:MAG TPA: tRNA glutamyl-Q(34) synthetase GluQRS [Thermoanaerobaculia bacterium]|nr:tRNA glutamyl-Q(34) synthetase GluQRS [Thermoanaerobaculia bacterium]